MVGDSIPSNLLLESMPVHIDPSEVLLQLGKYGITSIDDEALNFFIRGMYYLSKRLLIREISNYL